MSKSPRRSRVLALLAALFLLPGIAGADWLQVIAVVKSLVSQPVATEAPASVSPIVSELQTPSPQTVETSAVPQKLPPISAAVGANTPSAVASSDASTVALDQTPTEVPKPAPPPATPQNTTPAQTQPAQNPTPGQTAPTTGGQQNNGIVQTPAGATPVTPPQGPLPEQSSNPRLINNVFSGTDIREAFSEVASAAGVSIIPDETIKNTLVYMEFRNEPLESAIQKLAMLSGAYVKKISDTVYLVSQATPEAGLFREFAETRSYMPKNISATALQTLLPPNYKSYVQTDVKTNHLSITAPSELLPRIESDLRQIDAPARQFVVEALVTEVNDTTSKDFAFTWAWKNFAQNSDLSFTYTHASVSDIATIKALIGNGKATLRANPRITAFEGQEADLEVGQETYYSLLTGNVQYPTAQIQLIKTGVTLKFTGYIGDDGMITLDLAPEVSDAIVSINGNPTTNVRHVTTQVRVHSGDTIAIAGLIQEQSSREVTRVPILGYIPIIGELFTQRENSGSRREVIILITPHLTDQGTGVKGIDSGRQVPPP